MTWRAVRILDQSVVVMCAGSSLTFGLWALVWPRSFAAFIDFPPYNEHLLHDVGAFQIGIGAMLMLSLFWTDARSLSLFGFAISGWIHAIHHGLDLGLGGHMSDQWILGSLALLATLVLASRANSAQHSRSTRAKELA